MFNKKRTYFTNEEALAEIGNEVKPIHKISSVPHWSKGVVLKAEEVEIDRWVVVVRWYQPSTYFDGAFLYARGFSLLRGSKVHHRRHAKNEYELLDSKVSQDEVNQMVDRIPGNTMTMKFKGVPGCIVSIILAIVGLAILVTSIGSGFIILGIIMIVAGIVLAAIVGDIDIKRRHPLE